mmetsp:Transcript_15786/g.37130  ORF Transcript_15786/g.37130 Transcript_15786/m.37130 type:complete len:218 (+) Transcript_15786:46-699(+)
MKSCLEATAPNQRKTRSSNQQRRSFRPKTLKALVNSSRAQGQGGCSLNSSSSSSSSEIDIHPPKHAYARSALGPLPVIGLRPITASTPADTSSSSSCMNCFLFSAHRGSLEGTDLSSFSFHLIPASRYRSSKSLSMWVTMTRRRTSEEALMPANKLSASCLTCLPARITHSSVIAPGSHLPALTSKRPMSFRCSSAPSPKPGLSTKYTGRASSSPSG